MIYSGLLKKHLSKLHLNEEIINKIIKKFIIKVYKKEELFSISGKNCNKLGFVINGIFCLYKEKENGNIMVIDLKKNNEFLLASFNPEEESKVTIKSLKNSIILEAKYSEIITLFKKYPALGELAKKDMESRVETIYSRLESFSVNEAANRYNQFKADFANIIDEIPQYLIASYIGVTPTQLSRIRKKIYNLLIKSTYVNDILLFLPYFIYKFKKGPENVIKSRK